MKNKLFLYAQLIRLHQPIGTFLLLWPTLSALWIASNGMPSWKNLAIFMVGTFLMRSAGCAINDFADRHIDAHVERTKNRPLVTGVIKPKEAVWVAGFLILLSFGLVLFLPPLAIQIAVIALVVACSYPYFKRFFAIPQAYLGIAFGFGIPIAFAAAQNNVPFVAWGLWIANLFWVLAYDTEYAMVDKKDDQNLGIRTSALTFGRSDIAFVIFFYIAMLLIWLILAWQLQMGIGFYLGWFATVLCVCHQAFLIKNRDKKHCFAAFQYNNYLGGLLFFGIVLDYALR